MPISISFGASDADSPPQIHPPTGAAINPTNGLFTWIPAEEQGDHKYTIGVQVTDDGIPALFDRATIDVNIVSFRAVRVEQLFNTRIYYQGLTDHRYQLEFTDRLENPVWTKGETRTATGGFFGPVFTVSLLLDNPVPGQTNSIPQRFYRIVHLD